MASKELIHTPWYLNATWKAYLSVYYRFESGALTTDSSGNGNTLTAISDPSEDGNGAFGGAVYFDTDDAYSRADDVHFKPTGDFTVGCWLKTTTVSAVLFQSYSQNTAVAGWRIRVQSSGGIALYSGKNTGTTVGTDFQAVATGALNDGTWHFVVSTWDGSNLNISADGSDFLSVAWANAPVYAATNYIRVGCGNETGANKAFSNASLDEVFILKGVAMTQNQVKKIYETSVKSFNGLSVESIKSINEVDMVDIFKINGLQ